MKKVKNDQSEDNKEKKGIFSRLFGGGKKSACCEMQIIPMEELENLQKEEIKEEKKD